jgi:hypothetical protein
MRNDDTADKHRGGTGQVEARRATNPKFPLVR